MVYCKCKKCGERFVKKFDTLWEHLEIDHPDDYYDNQGDSDSDMFKDRFILVADPRKSYRYFGVVTQFGKIIENDYIACTYAENARQAKRNILYQYKQAHGLEPWAKIEMPNKIEEIYE